MKNMLKAATLEHKFPLLNVEQGCILSKDADLTVGYRVSLPELFTLTAAEYEAMHAAWVKAVKVFPNFSIVHKQDWFSEERYVPDTDREDAGFLALTQTVGSGVEALNHARQLADMELRRRLILFGAELEAKAQADADNAVEWAISQLDGITGDACRLDTARPVREVIDETLQELERRQQAHQSGLCVGIATGLPHLDRITGGWRGGQLVVLAGRPAMGKTAVSLTFARAAAAAGIPVCYFSLEMPDTQLVGRMLVGTSGIDSSAFRSGDVTTDDWRRIEIGAEMLRGLPFYLFDAAALSMARIRAQSRAMQRRGCCKMVVIDYLQLLEGGADRRNNREREVAEMSRAAKLLAKELNIPVILLAQLSRKVEERADKTPLLSDLRESGAIEQDADMVIFIDRPAVYGIDSFDGGARYGTIPSQGVGRLTIAKNREGGTGFIPFRHNESLTCIADYECEPAEAIEPF